MHDANNDLNIVRIPKVKIDDGADEAATDWGAMAEMGLSVAERENLDKPGEATQNLEGEKVRCLPGGDGNPVEVEAAVEEEETVTYLGEGMMAEMGLSLEMKEKGRSSG